MVSNYGDLKKKISKVIIHLVNSKFGYWLWSIICSFEECDISEWISVEIYLLFSVHL